MPIITDLAPPGTTEGFILDPTGTPLDVVSGGSFGMVSLAMPPAKRRPEWASSGDADGSELVREPYYYDRECTMQLRVQTTSMDQAVSAIGLLQGKLQEAIKLAAGGGAGLAFLWTPAHATVGLTGYMMLGEITDMPIDWNGWFQAKPTVTVAFTAKPFLYGAEVTGPTATGTAPLLTVAVPSVPGDVPAEARLVITDGATQARRWVEWGLEQRYYNAGAPSSLLIDSEDLVTSGFAGTQATRTGGYRRAAATHDTVSATLLAQPIALCGTGTLPHIGMFRVKARIWATSTAEYWRITWQDGDAPLSSNAWVQPIAAGFNELDLGVVAIQAAPTGSQKWTGRIEAYTTTAGGEVGEVDYLILVPLAEGYGRLEGRFSYTHGVITGHDEFEGTPGTALNTRTAPAGGSWATSGATTDLTIQAVGTSGTDDGIQRATASDADYRYAILGTATPSDTEVGTDIYMGTFSPTIDTHQGLVARWTDSSNYLRLRLERHSPSGTLYLEQVVTGAVTVLASVGNVAYVNTWGSLRLVAFASGRCLGWLLYGDGSTLRQVDVLASAMATGGALATGKVGIIDRNTGSVSQARNYDNFYAATPTTEQVVVNSGRSLEVRSNSNLRQSSDGTTYGDIVARGSRLFIPQAGDGGRTSRIAVRATREDIVTSASRNDADSVTLSVFYKPRYLAVPR
jgi:hypothetical protein